jgi:hypothetical protein
MVLTHDEGPQPVLITTRTHLSRQELTQTPHLRPILPKAGSLGPNLPDRDLLVSPQHRMLLSGWRAQLLFSADQLLAPAKGLLNDSTILSQTAKQGVTYIHLAFARHQIITANGAPTESLHTGDVSKEKMHPAAREELFALFPDLRTQPDNRSDTARTCLTFSETRLLVPSLPN